MNQFKMNYKLNPDDENWTVMVLSFNWFSSKWDKDEILSNMFEYAYAMIPSESDDDDAADKVVIENMLEVANAIHTHFHEKEESEAQKAFRQDLLFFEASDSL